MNICGVVPDVIGYIWESLENLKYATGARTRRRDDENKQLDIIIAFLLDRALQNAYKVKVQP